VLKITERKNTPEDLRNSQFNFFVVDKVSFKKNDNCLSEE
jgi:hypothetical protein